MDETYSSAPRLNSRLLSRRATVINPADQPDVIDHLHRLLRDTDLYLKVATIRHRTRLLRTAPLHVGVQEDQDVDGFEGGRSRPQAGQIIGDAV
jgi:hypothetical protein